MPHLDEINLLKRRAKGFLARAQDSLNAGDHDLAVFLSEQAVKLHLKSILLGEVGDYPRTHSISTLISVLEKMPKHRAVVKLLNRVETSLLEDAYIASRYLLRTYTREEAERAIGLAKEVLAYGEVH